MKLNTVYSDIPSVCDFDEDPMAKVFLIDVCFADALTSTLMVDGDAVRNGFINTLEGPANEDIYELDVGLTRSMIAKQLAERKSKQIEIPQYNLKLGIIDVVTYPFYFALTHNLNFSDSDLRRKLWKINTNLINHYCPFLIPNGKMLSIFHFSEKPIDDSPCHNILMLVDIPNAQIVHLIKQFFKGALSPQIVSMKQPIMDDRYALSKRRKEDGNPFNLLTFQMQCRSK